MVYSAGAMALAAAMLCAPLQGQMAKGKVKLRVDDDASVTLWGNVHPLARGEFDRGLVDGEMHMDRIVLALKASPTQQAALDALVEAQQDPQSALYHQWLTPPEYGARFGVTDGELSQVTAWLVGHGFAVEEIPAGRRMVVFAGTAGQVFDAFRTEVHRYRVGGAMHIANAEDPQVPKALAGVVSGVVSLNDFRHRPEMMTERALDSGPEFTAGSTHYLFPADFATVYDLNPLYSAGTNGEGVPIAIAGRSDIKLSDVAAFRTIANLPANAPTVTLAGSDPGLVATDQDEATLDVEWSGAVAPAAQVHLVTAASTATTDGVDLAAAYIVNHATAPLVSVSYGSCEEEMGAAELAFYNSLWEQAASQGMSVFVASGDSGAAGCAAATDAKGTSAGVNGLCSSPFATCVGGTELSEGGNAAQYWAAANAVGYASALGYIPERVWNESVLNGGTGLWASGGGASEVYAQPSWQAEVSGAGAANGMRGVPDVAVAAANHDGYLMVEDGARFIASGTSAAAPAFAGVMALVVSARNGATLGSANRELYALASGSETPFHATVAGNNSVPGVAGFAASGATYNLATGLGSVDGATLVNEWNAVHAVAPIAIRPVGCSRTTLLLSRCRPRLQAPLPWRGLGAR